MCDVAALDEYGPGLGRGPLGFKHGVQTTLASFGNDIETRRAGRVWCWGQQEHQEAGTSAD